MEIAIPIVALGDMYIISNQKKEKKKNNSIKEKNYKENFGNRKINTLPEKNYPVDDTSQQAYKRNLNYYSGANENTELPKYNPGSNITDQYKSTKFESLTGETMSPEELTHNNEVPYFGSNITQSIKGYEGLLDSYTGAGSQNIQKKESAPLFKSQKDMDWSSSNGMPSFTQYMQDRMRNNVTSKMNNTKPWEEIQVGPGLNEGFSHEGSGGFNSGMEARDKWLPKNVDQLRVKNNPKNTYEKPILGPHTGKRSNRGEIGKMEKNRPDTYFIQGSDRWLTTTGAEKASTVRSENILRDVNRLTTNKEHFGVIKSDNNGMYQKGVYNPSNKTTLDGNLKHLGAVSASNKGTPSKSDYGKNGYSTLTNSRSLTGSKTQLGGAYNSTLNALVTPILDVLKPTRKQNVVGNMRPTGNVQSNITTKYPVWNPNDTPKTTIKEQTENNYYTRPGGWAIDGAHTTNPHQPVYGQRDTTTCPALGNPSGTESTGAKGRIYNSEYNSNLNYNKEKLVKIDRINQGNTNKLNNKVNYNYYKSKATNAVMGNGQYPSSSSGTNVIGVFSSKNSRETGNQYNRNSSDMLNAFNNNPYTHSLTSVV